MPACPLHDRREEKKLGCENGGPANRIEGLEVPYLDEVARVRLSHQSRLSGDKGGPRRSTGDHFGKALQLGVFLARFD